VRAALAATQWRCWWIPGAWAKFPPLALSALQHPHPTRSCYVWDLGSRNKKRGAPRALWAGLEFVRWCLDTRWLHRPGGGSGGGGGGESGGESGSEGAGSGSDDGGDSGGGGGGAAPRPPPQAHLRGHRVTAEFEAHARRRFSQSTKRRLQYYARYAAPGLPGVRLFGIYRATGNDGDAGHYAALARAWDAPPGAGGGGGSGAAAGGARLGAAAEEEEGAGGRDAAAWRALVAGGWGVFAGGIGHADYFPALRALGVVDGGGGGGRSGGGCGGGGGGRSSGAGGAG
jgi:hypothetical protein